MKEFNFLTDHSHFHAVEMLDDVFIYEFSFTKNNHTYGAVLGIPATYETSFIYWSFESETDSLSCYNLEDDIQHTPAWFQTLYAESDVALERKNRLRKLFAKKPA